MFVIYRRTSISAHLAPWQDVAPKRDAIISTGYDAVEYTKVSAALCLAIVEFPER